VSSLFDALASRPGISRSLAAHLRELFESGTVPRRTKELCSLMVAWLCACDYCTCVHEEVAKRAGVDTQTLAQLSDYARSPLFSDAERAALAAAVALTREPRALPPNLWDALRRHYDKGECVEILAVIGVNNYIARVSNGLAVQTHPA
jgi:AhpD family alkylhydroperoxidase